MGACITKYKSKMNITRRIYLTHCILWRVTDNQQSLVAKRVLPVLPVFVAMAGAWHVLSYHTPRNPRPFHPECGKSSTTPSQIFQQIHASMRDTLTKKRDAMTCQVAVAMFTCLYAQAAPRVAQQRYLRWHDLHQTGLASCTPHSRPPPEAPLSACDWVVSGRLIALASRFAQSGGW
jgi:hypothetical protein